MASSGFVGFSGVDGWTTGGVRTTRLCNPAILKAGAERLSRDLLSAGTPHTNTKTLSNIHGTHAALILSGLGIGAMTSVAGISVCSCFHFCLGCQNLSNNTVAAIEQTEATMSTSHGPWKLEIRNWGMAKASPAVSAAGHTPSIARKPAMAQTTQKGTMNEKNGSWRPTICESASSLMPVTLLNAMMGVPSAPKATGAVLAIKDRPEAARGLKPS